MRAVYAESLEPRRSAGGTGGRRAPDPEPPEGWTHGRGQGGQPQPPRPVVAARRRPQGGTAADDPRLRRGRHRRRHRRRGGRPLGHQRPGWTGDETVDPRPHPAVGEAPGHAGRVRRRAQAQRRAQAGRAVLRRGGVPADRVADGLPHAVRRSPACARGRRCSCRARAAAWPRRASRWPARPGCGSTPPRAREAKQRRALELGAHAGVRLRRAAAREGRRGDGDRRRGHVVAFGEVAQAGRADRHLGRHLGVRTRRPTSTASSSCSSSSSVRRWGRRPSWRA